MSARRIDYLDDPNAPAPTSVVPSANVIVVNDEGTILLIRRTDNGNLALPGGGMDLGETITQAAVREVKEETGLDVEITGLVGIYTNPRHLNLKETPEWVTLLLRAWPRRPRILRRQTM